MTLPLYYVSGLPRSGSTLLMNLLGQNPAHHVTPTSGLIELFVMVKNRWPEFIEFKAQGLEKVKPRVLGALRGLLAGYFDSEIASGKTVFDKSRGWLQYIEPLEEALQRPVKIIVTVRDVRAIVASFEKIYRQRSIDYREAANDTFFQCQTIEGRARVLLGPKSVVGLTIARLRDVLARGLGDRLVIIPYRALTSAPRETMDLLHAVLGLPGFQYDPNHVEQITQEDDSFHGMRLHNIRSRVEPPEEAPWQGILPAKLCHWIETEYADINSLSSWRHAGPSMITTVSAVSKRNVAEANGKGKSRDPSDFVGLERQIAANVVVARSYRTN